MTHCSRCKGAAFGGLDGGLCVRCFDATAACTDCGAEVGMSNLTVFIGERSDPSRGYDDLVCSDCAAQREADDVRVVAR